MDVTFDATWHHAFMASPCRLRFELGGKDLRCAEAPVPRFVQALTRARTIRDAVLADAPRLWAVVASAAHPAGDLSDPAPDGFAALSKLGFRGSAVAQWRARLDPNEPGQSEEDVIWRAFDVTSDIASQDALLWASIGYEMPIEPKSPVVCWLADFDREILLHVYDDRGMDVVALTAAPLLPFYKRFDAWLLDHDRERMEAAFAGA